MAVTSRTSKKQTNKKISLEPYFLSRSVYLSCWVSLPSWFFLIVYFLCLGNLRVVVGIMMDLYVSVAQSRPTLCDPMNCSPPDHSVVSRQEYLNGLPFPSPGDLPYSGIKPRFPVLQADSLLSEPPGKPHHDEHPSQYPERYWISWMLKHGSFQFSKSWSKMDSLNVSFHRNS